MNITKTSLPEHSLLNASTTHYNYVDSYQGTFNDIEDKFTSTDIGKAFFASGPKWIDKLFRLRNSIVSLFGLKTAGDKKDREKQLQNFKCNPGEQLGLFKVFAKNENEVVLGEDDQHLNFRVSLFIDQLSSDASNKRLTISTTVIFNNRFGRIYFLPVRSFHKLIVPTMIKGIIKELERGNV